MLSVTNTITYRGNVVSVRNGEFNSSFVLTNEAILHSVIGKPLSNLANEIADRFSDLGKRRGDLSEIGFNKSAKTVVEGLRAAWLITTASIHDAQKAHADKFRTIRTVSDPVHGREWRDRLAKMQSTDVIRIAHTNPTARAAIVAGGAALAGLDADTFTKIERLAYADNARSVLANQSNYRTPATIDDPVGGAVDSARVAKEAEELLAGMDAERELLDSVRPTLRKMLGTVAIASNLPAEAALKLLSGSEV